LVIKKHWKVLGEVRCPVCDGEGKIYVVEPNDMVDVEIMFKNTDFVKAVIHKKGTLVPRFRHATMSVREVFGHYRNTGFCYDCFGKYVIYNNELYRTDW